MACTVGIYKENLSDSKINFQDVISTLQGTFPEKSDSAIRVMEKISFRLQTFYQVNEKESSKETKSI